MTSKFSRSVKNLPSLGVLKDLNSTHSIRSSQKTLEDTKDTREITADLINFNQSVLESSRERSNYVRRKAIFPNLPVPSNHKKRNGYVPTLPK